MKKYNLLFLGALAFCSACSQSTGQDPAAPQVNWKKLADGSSYSTENSTDKTSEAIRCWPKEGKFQCVTIRTFDGDSHTIRRFMQSTLERPTNFEIDGYSCSVITTGMSAYSEEVSANGQKLTSNFVFDSPARTKPWQAEFVNGLLHESGLPNSYFACEKIAEVLREGSAASLGTSLVKQSDFD